MHLHEHIQIIILVVYRRVAKLLVIIPADNVTAIISATAVSDSVVPDLLREKIKPFPLISELFEDIIGKPGIAFE